MKHKEIIRGTTPTQIFTIPISESQISALEVTYSQFGLIVFSKDKSDVTFSGKKISFRLSQEETLNFVCKPNSPVFIQITIVENNGQVIKSNIVPVIIVDSLIEEVL